MACPACEGGKKGEPLCDECQAYITPEDKAEDAGEELAIDD